MTRDDVQRWLDRYVEAWRTYDPGQVGALFAPDAVYRSQPWEQPPQAAVGRDAIVAGWLSPGGDPGQRDAPGTYDAHYEPFAIDGDRAVAIGWSRYWTGPDRATERATYDNVFLLEFAPDGTCRSYTEFYMTRPEGNAAA